MKTFTDIMFEATAPYDNPFQGKDKRVLFVCSAGILRSATAARIYAKKYNTRCAGSAPYALVPLSANLLAWAQEVVFVNKENYEDACKDWEFTQDVTILDIPDQYPHMHPELIKAFEEQYDHAD